MTTTPAAAWVAHAGSLASWAFARLLNRDHAWGAYTRVEDRGKSFTRKGGTEGKVPQSFTAKGKLTLPLLARHFRGYRHANLIGLHSTSPQNTSRWGALDIDWHGPTSTAPEINQRAALAWHDRLVRDGWHPLLLDSNGKGGFHLWLLLAEAVPTPRFFHFLQQLTADHDQHGMTKRPETFPKQAELRPHPDGKPSYGNWLRLPGRHHTREHWSRVWDGSRWLDGAEAVNFMLALQGDRPDLLPEVPPPATPQPTSPRRYVRPVGGDNRAARAAAYMARLPNLGEGQGRDDVAYKFAAFLARDLNLADDVALDWLGRWDQGNSPPKGPEVLAEILANARLYGQRPIGCGLAATRPKGRHRHHKTTVLHFSVRI